MHVIINSIALFYLLPFISVGIYTIGTQKIFTCKLPTIHWRYHGASFRPFDLRKISHWIYLLDVSVGSHVIRVLLE